MVRPVKPTHRQCPIDLAAERQFSRFDKTRSTRWRAFSAKPPPAALFKICGFAVPTFALRSQCLQTGTFPIHFMCVHEVRTCG